MPETKFVSEVDIAKAKLIKQRLKTDFLPVIDKLLRNYGVDNERKTYLLLTRTKIEKALNLIDRVFGGKSYDVNDYVKLEATLKDLHGVGTVLQGYMQADQYFATIVNTLDETDNTLDDIRNLNLQMDLNERGKVKRGLTGTLLSKLGKGIKKGAEGIVGGGILGQIAAPILGPFYGLTAAAAGAGLWGAKKLGGLFGGKSGSSGSSVENGSYASTSSALTSSNSSGTDSMGLYEFFDKGAHVASWTRDLLKTLKEIAEGKSGGGESDKKEGWWSKIKDFVMAVPVLGTLLSKVLPLISSALPLLGNAVAIAGAAVIGWKAGQFINDKLIDPFRKETEGSGGLRVLRKEQEAATYFARIGSAKGFWNTTKAVFGSGSDEDNALIQNAKPNKDYIEMQQKRKEAGKSYWENGVFHENTSHIPLTVPVSNKEDLINDQKANESIDILKNIHEELKNRPVGGPLPMQGPFDLSDPLLNSLNMTGEVNR